VLSWIGSPGCIRMIASRVRVNWGLELLRAADYTSGGEPGAARGGSKSLSDINLRRRSYVDFQIGAGEAGFWGTIGRPAIKSMKQAGGRDVSRRALYTRYFKVGFRFWY